MKTKQLFYVGDFLDLKSVLQEFENIEKVHYFQAGLFNNSIIPKFDSIFEYKKLGIVENGDWNHTTTFLILPYDYNLEIREVMQKTGGLMYAVDQMINPYSIIIKTSGIFKDGVLVAGSIGTISEDSISLRLFKSLSKIFKKQFKKTTEFYIGTEAKEKSISGWRLVTDDRLPKEYDIFF
jgi:hypothetical protein